jgi:thioredoxin-related protein
MKKIIFVILFLAHTGFAQIDFMKGSLSDAFQKAKSENKLLMIDVFTDWCKWCIELDNKVYSQKDVYEFANSKQVNFKIDAEKGEGKDFAKKYKVNGYPTILFLDGDGNEIDRIVGYEPAPEFLATMEDYHNGINTITYLKKKLENDPGNIDANLKMADKCLAVSNNKDAKEYLKKIIETDPQNTLGKTDEARFNLATLADTDKVVSELENFINNYPNSKNVTDAYMYLARLYAYEKNEPVAAGKYFQLALNANPDDWQVKMGYGEFLYVQAGRMINDTSGAPKDYAKAMDLLNESTPYNKGNVNEASTSFFKSRVYYETGDYQKALDEIDNAIKIFDKKNYRSLKTAIEKKLGSE